MKRLLQCFVKIDVIEVDEVTKTLYDTVTDQLGNDNTFVVGDETTALAVSLSEEEMNHKITCIYNNVRQFYVTMVKKMFEKFPFTSTFLSRFENIESC